MNVTYVDMPRHDEVYSDLYVRIDWPTGHHMMVHVAGYGTADYTVKIVDEDGQVPKTIQYMVPENGLFDSTTFGTALTWASPITIGHLVADFVTGQ